MAPSILSCTPSCTSCLSDLHAALNASMPHSPLLAPGGAMGCSKACILVPASTGCSLRCSRSSLVNVTSPVQCGRLARNSVLLSRPSMVSACGRKCCLPLPSPPAGKCTMPTHGRLIARLGPKPLRAAIASLENRK
eukprot:scaffold94240_cov69-Phaeocystis_antarctica.AAC.5